MKFTAGAFVIAAALAAPTAAGAAALAAYVGGPSITEVQLSADGKMLAYATTSGDESHLIVQTIDDRKPIADVILGRQTIDGIRWAGPQRILVMTVQDVPVFGLTRGEKTLIQSIDLQAKKTTDLMKDVTKGVNTILGEPSIRLNEDGGAKAVVKAPYYSPGMSIGLYETDLIDGHSKLVAAAEPDVRDWQADRAGKPLAQIRYSFSTHHWDVMAKRGLNWLPTVGGTGSQSSFFGLTSDGTPIVWFPGAVGAALRSVSSSGEVTDLLPGSGYERLLRGTSQRVYGAGRKDKGLWSYQFIDAADQKRWDAVAKAYSGAAVDWVTASDDGKRLIVLVTPTNETPYYAFVDIPTGKSRVLGDLYAGLAAKDIAPTTKVEFSATDGVRLTAYLTATSQTPRKPAPLVVLPPTTVSDWSTGDFDVRAQALASHGYAVLHVNYRSLVNPANVTEFGVGELGDKSISDLSAAVKQLVADGSVDPARVCIVGFGALGGYTAMAAAARDPTLYRCVFADDNMFNLKSWMQTSYEWADDSLRTQFGLRGAASSKFVALSPYYAADKIKAPVMLSMFADDTGFARNETHAMVRALQKSGGKVELRTIHDAHEAWWTPSGQVKSFSLILDFIEKNNPPN